MSNKAEKLLTAAPNTNLQHQRASAPRSLQGHGEKPPLLPPFHWYLVSPLCYFFLSLLGFCQKKKKQPPTPHWSWWTGAGSRGNSAPDLLLHPPETPEQGLPEQQPLPLSHLYHINCLLLINWFWNRSGFLTPTASLSNEFPCLTHSAGKHHLPFPPSVPLLF